MHKVQYSFLDRSGTAWQDTSLIAELEDVTVDGEFLILKNIDDYQFHIPLELVSYWVIDLDAERSLHVEDVVDESQE